MRMQLLCENNKVKTKNVDLGRKMFTFVKMKWLASQVSIQVFKPGFFVIFVLWDNFKILATRKRWKNPNSCSFS